jgi:hypothetical protein
VAQALSLPGPEGTPRLLGTLGFLPGWTVLYFGVTRTILGFGGSFMP